jgi:hypothetical protein
MQGLDRDRRAEGLVLADIDGAHAAGGEEPHDLVLAERLVDEGVRTARSAVMEVFTDGTSGHDRRWYQNDRASDPKATSANSSTV